MSQQDLEMICKRIGEAIESAQMSYGEVAEKTGIPKSAVHRYATGITTKVPLDRLQKIAAATGTSSEWIMGWDESQQKKPPEDRELSAFEESVIKICRAVPEDRQADFVALLMQMLGLFAGQGSGGQGESSQ